MSFKEFNLTFSSFLIAGCVLDMAMGSFFEFYLIYFFYLFIIINVFGGVKPDLTALKRNVPYTLSAILFVIAAIASFVEIEDLPIVRGEIFNIIWWTLFIIYTNTHIRNINDLNFLLKRVFLLTFWFGIIASLCGAYKFISIMNGNDNEAFYTDYGVLINGTSLSSDYNVFAMAIILGILSGKYLFENTSKRLTRIFILVSQLFMMGIVLFSNSRRGFIFIIISIFVLVFYSLNKQTRFKSKAIKNLALLTVIIVVVLVLFGDYFNFLSADINSVQIFNRLNTLKTGEASSQRLDRLDYGMELLNDKYSVIDIIIGRGFSYMEFYSNKFSTQFGADHPHNFFLSTLLYGGIFSFVLIVYLCFKVSMAYIRNIHLFKILPFWFLILLIVAFTSTNSWFSIRLMIILSLIPFMRFNANLKL